MYSVTNSVDIFTYKMKKSEKAEWNDKKTKNINDTEKMKRKST